MPSCHGSLSAKKGQHWAGDNLQGVAHSQEFIYPDPVACLEFLVGSSQYIVHCQWKCRSPNQYGDQRSARPPRFFYQESQVSYINPRFESIFSLQRFSTPKFLGNGSGDLCLFQNPSGQRVLSNWNWRIPIMCMFKVTATATTTQKTQSSSLLGSSMVEFRLIMSD